MLEEFYASLLDGGDEDDGLPPTELTLAKLPGLPHVKIVINKNEGVHKEPHFHIVIKDVSEASIAIRDPWWLLRRSAGIPRARLSLADHVCRHDHARRRRRRLASVATVFARGGRLAAPPSRHSAAVGRQAEGDPTRPDRVGRARCLDADVEECAAHRPARDASSLASRRLQGPVALAEPTALRKAPPRRDRRVDSLDGVQQLDVGGGKNPRRIAQARDQSQQTHDPEVHTRSPAGQTAWAALVHVLAKPCPRSLGVRLSASLRRVLPRDLCVRVIELASRRIVFAATTRAPSQAWVTQQLRNATPFGEAPKFLIRDRDDKFGPNFDAVARASGIRVLRTAMRAPNMNAICERFLGSLRRECLDHVIVLDDVHLQRVVTEYVRYYTAARPHQGLRQRIPLPPNGSAAAARTGSSTATAEGIRWSRTPFNDNERPKGGSSSADKLCSAYSPDLSDDDPPRMLFRI